MKNNTYLSENALNIQESITMKITALAKQLKAQGEDVIGFGAGEPDFDTPEIAKNAGQAAIQAGHTKYTPAAGLQSLREAVANYESHLLNTDIQANQIVISNGGKHAIMNILLATLNAGDEVIVPSPYWVSYPEQIALAGGKTVYVDTDDSSGFKLTATQLKAALNPNTKMIILNSPSNPTGALYSESELEALAEVLNNHDCLILSDEIYAQLVYDDLKHCSILSHIQNKARVIIASGASKAFSMTGWRIGYSISDTTLAKSISSLQSHMSGNPCSISQYAALAAYESFPSEVIATMKAAFIKRRNFMVETLNSIPGFSCLKPEGAFYAFPNISGCFGKKSPAGNVIKDSVSFCEYLLAEAKVACVPGAGFGSDDYMRLSYATSDANIEKGLAKIKAWVETLT